MQFLKTLFWVLLAGLGIAFAFNNWFAVPIQLWGALIADVNLPLLLLIAFLAGLLPMLLVYHAVRWRLRQRLTGLERALADLRAATAPIPATNPVVVDVPKALAEPEPEAVVEPVPAPPPPPPAPPTSLL